MVYTPGGVVSYGFPQAADPFTFTYLISGTFADDAAMAAVAGKAVAWDSAAANTVKLAGNGDTVIGRIFTGERRAVLGINVVSVQRKFKEKLPATAGHGIVVGNAVMGAGAGLVKLSTVSAGAGVPSDPRVVEIGTDYVVAELF
jgi:hypothetical protein